MLAQGRECARLAADDDIRPYDDPMDGATMNAYLLERITWRLDNYRDIEQSLTMVFKLTIPAMVNIARRSRRTLFWLARLIPGKTLVRRCIMQTTEMLFIVKAVIRNHYTILDRNLLLVDEHKDRMQGWKQNLNRITAGWINLRNILDFGYRRGHLAERVGYPRLSALFHDMTKVTQKLKYAMKAMHILHRSHNMLAISDAKTHQKHTHPTFQT